MKYSREFEAYWKRTRIRTPKRAAWAAWKTGRANKFKVSRDYERIAERATAEADRWQKKYGRLENVRDYYKHRHEVLKQYIADGCKDTDSSV